MELDPTWLRNHYKKIILFNGRLGENIALSKPSATIDEVIAVAKMAGAHEYVRKSSRRL